LVLEPKEKKKSKIKTAEVAQVDTAQEDRVETEPAVKVKKSRRKPKKQEQIEKPVLVEILYINYLSWVLSCPLIERNNKLSSGKSCE
jgi:hypothetical protein